MQDPIDARALLEQIEQMRSEVQTQRALARRLQAVAQRAQGLCVAALAALLATVALGTMPAVQAQGPGRNLPERVAVLEAKMAPLTLSGTDLVIEGVNVHIRDGSGQTVPDSGVTPSGLGNLTLGYNASRIPGLDSVPNDRTGSHNLILGDKSNYSGSGGLVAGFKNEISGPYATVTGGEVNEASGRAASVTGGAGNRASGEDAAVSGGLGNVAFGGASSVSGGNVNSAGGAAASVSGGQGNRAAGNLSSVSGGRERSTAAGHLGVYDWVAGSLFEDQ